MSETNETTQETPEVSTPAATETPAKNPIDLAIESVMDLINALGLFATITRGALGSGVGLVCEVAPSTPQEVFLDKNAYIPLTLAINGKHFEIETLTGALNTIQDLSRQKTYPSGNGYEIVDISRGNLPRIIGREENNAFIMSCDLVVKIYRKDEVAT